MKLISILKATALIAFFAGMLAMFSPGRAQTQMQMWQCSDFFYGPPYCEGLIFCGQLLEVKYCAIVCEGPQGVAEEHPCGWGWW
jgi:hypothetical protein